MRLSRLQIRNIRNIGEASLELGPSINLIVGPNGSGKTSVLESFYFLGTARTFRTGKQHTLLKEGEDVCLVKGVSESGQEMSVLGQNGLSKKMTLGGRLVERASELAEKMPFVVLGPQTVNLLVGGPEYRRRFLNWGVFHVEPGFRRVWEGAKRCLSQRNRLLKSGGVVSEEVDSWTAEFVRLSERIHLYRKSYMSSFKEKFKEISEITGLAGIEVGYRRGWSTGVSLKEDLATSLHADVKKGYTSKGFHRADMVITVGKREAAGFCSRGELKRLSWALLLAQGEELRGEVIYLVDDLTSELDKNSRKRICRYLDENGSQLVVTGANEEELSSCWQNNGNTMFHVEHGVVTKE
ncbi:MAG: DNA replication/repair protein RecF [Candidatus Azotimanducaceae bacterium]|uniref:DNA replication and repair protein RecF n=1 Tax=OM182 bacterium TaxID=2510334 RepID=A0A520S5G5_9GAMM|nr:DNA replication/repair protein RecF [Gammaproteobacteria bacterium]OUV68378.1 MAG: DNA replication/repair protein RecF [Gammaproteobacteria bacterium TMED133]RZO77735.1 MAG: DNA replication/repair protein RecF [OM182 bacterium]